MLPFMYLISSQLSFQYRQIRRLDVVNNIRQNDPWLLISPVFLPEDEQKVAKMFVVGTLEDTAFVAGISLQKLRRLTG